MSQLRKLIPDGTAGPPIETRAPGYRIRVAAGEIDVDRFEELAVGRADNEDYLAYSRESPAAVGRYGGKVVALGHRGTEVIPGATPARNAIVLVEWPDLALGRACRLRKEPPWTGSSSWLRSR